MRLILAALVAVSLVACSSSKERSLEERDNRDTIERDYEVKDALSPFRPGWIEDPTLWAQQKDLDIKTYRYFSVETTPKVDRNAACMLAKSKVRAEIAAEIATYIEKTLSSYREGQASIDLVGESPGMKEYLETSLVEKTSRMVHGASIYKKYWEKRKYMEKLGAPKNYQAYTCAVYIRMKKDQLERLVQKAAQEVGQQVTEPELKKKVEKALQKVDQNFSNGPTT